MIMVLIVILVVHLSYYLVLFTRLIGHTDSIEKNSELISIVVCFKNEVDQVDKIIPQLLSQSADEIILVDDFSKDGTFEKLISYASRKVKVIKATTDKPGKKQANQDGIAAATYNRILFTDADCEPVSTDWASKMTEINKSIVLGYSPMKKTNGLVNLFSRYETYMTGLQYLSYALAGIPYMGVGRNMLLDKSLRAAKINSIKGQNLASGDDDLTVNAIATKENTGICIQPDSHVYTDSASTLAGFIRQKSRHISTSVHYQMKHQIMLGAFSASQILFYIFLIIGGVMGTIPIHLCIIAYAVKQVVQISIHTALIKKMNESIAIHQLLLLDLLLFLYYLVMPFILLIRKNDNSWS